MHGNWAGTNSSKTETHRAGHTEHVSRSLMTLPCVRPAAYVDALAAAADDVLMTVAGVRHHDGAVTPSAKLVPTRGQRLQQAGIAGTHGASRAALRGSRRGADSGVRGVCGVFYALGLTWAAALSVLLAARLRWRRLAGRRQRQSHRRQQPALEHGAAANKSCIASQRSRA